MPLGSVSDTTNNSIININNNSNNNKLSHCETLYVASHPAKLLQGPGSEHRMAVKARAERNE